MFPQEDSVAHHKSLIGPMINIRDRFLKSLCIVKWLRFFLKLLRLIISLFQDRWSFYIWFAWHSTWVTVIWKLNIRFWVRVLWRRIFFFIWNNWIFRILLSFFQFLLLFHFLLFLLLFGLLGVSVWPSSISDLDFSFLLKPFAYQPDFLIDLFNAGKVQIEEIVFDTKLVIESFNGRVNRIPREFSIYF